MDFEVNQWAVHPRHGVGRIAKIEAKCFNAGPERQYYRLEIPTGTVWVPVEGSTCGLRQLFAKKDLATYRNLLRSRPAPLDPDYRQRQITLAARQRESSFEARCKLVRDLTAFAWKKSLNEITSVMLQRASAALCAEWAAVMGLPIEKAKFEVQSLLLEGRQAFDQAG